jgi:outer membrane protein assembly factor BamA
VTGVVRRIGRAPCRGAALACVAIVSLSAQEKADTTHPHPRAPIIRVDSTPMTDVHSTGPIISPIAFYNPESGWGGGAGVVWVRLPEPHPRTQRPSTIQASAIATLTGQYTVSTQGDVWTDGNMWRYTYELTWGHNPNKFFGIGPATGTSSESYTPTTMRVVLGTYRQIRPHIYVGARYFFETADVTDIAAGGPLATGSVPGTKGWKLSQLGLTATYDTRNHYYFPTGGLLLSATAFRSDNAIGSEFNYSRFIVDLRGYRKVWFGHVVAGQLWLDMADGTLPFDRMPRVGGSNILRGFFGGRFRDQVATAAQVEYRTTAWHRFGGDVFAGLGSVAPSLRSFQSDFFRTAGGVGIRYSLTSGDRLNIRIDHGWGRAVSGTYFTVGEAF